MEFAVYFLFLFLFSANFLHVSLALPKFGNKNRRPSSLPSPELPQCTDNFVLSSEVQIMERPLKNGSSIIEGNDFEPIKRINITAHLQLATIALGETFCMLITANKTLDGEEDSSNEDGQKLLSEFGLQQNSNRLSMLHTIEYVRLELHHSITGIYKFAIPSISARCKCDCAGGETICNIEKYQYRNCSANGGAPLCYRTHRSGQPNSGCLTSAKADICCQVKISPHRDWTFQAIRLKQPSTVLILRYRIFERGQISSSQWANSVDETLAIPLNKGSTKIELNAGGEGDEEEEDKGVGERSRHRIEISAVGGRPHRQMEPGMYFYQIFGDGDQKQHLPAFAELRDGIALNAPGESSLEKLGWLRWEKGMGWTVRKGLEKITSAQHIVVEDCKGQRYRTTFNAEQFVLKNGGETQAEEIVNFDLGNPVKAEPWVGAVRIGEREVVVEHSEGVPLVLTIRTESRPKIVRHSSHLSNFTGTILLDKQSNRFLNLTFYNARGTLIGQIFSSGDSLSVMESIFSIDIGKFTVEKFQRIVATSVVQSPKLVCFYPIGDMEGRICQRLDFVDEPLQEKHFADQWQQGQSECYGCNERGVDSFLTSLDPRLWLDGLNTPAEFFTCILELVLCIGLCLLCIFSLTKCIIPLCRCVCFISKPAKK